MHIVSKFQIFIHIFTVVIGIGKSAQHGAVAGVPTGGRCGTGHGGERVGRPVGLSLPDRRSLPPLRHRKHSRIRAPHLRTRLSRWGTCPLVSNFLMKSSNYKKTSFPGDFFYFLSLQENASRYRNEFDIIQCVFELCILCRNFRFLFVFLLW